MAGMEQFKNQTYLNLRTVRKNGDALETPVWFVQDGEKLYVRTIAGSGKVKRVNNNPNVHIMPCGQMGQPLGAWVAAQAHEALDKTTYDHVRSLLIAKYGDVVKTLEIPVQERGNSYTVLLIEPEEV